MTLKEQNFKKIKKDVIYWPRKNDLQLSFFWNLFKKYLEECYTITRNKFHAIVILI